MSATKATWKWSKTASLDELLTELKSLTTCLDNEKNMMLRSSLAGRLRIVEAAIAAKGGKK